MSSESVEMCILSIFLSIFHVKLLQDRMSVDCILNKLLTGTWLQDVLGAILSVWCPLWEAYNDMLSIWNMKLFQMEGHGPFILKNL